MVISICHHSLIRASYDLIFQSYNLFTIRSLLSFCSSFSAVVSKVADTALARWPFG